MSRSRPRSGTAAIALLLAGALSLAGCATPQRPDPLEKLNRQVFAFNEGVDKYVIVPPATVYRDVVPQTIRLGISNFFNNLRDAWSAVNLVLQGRFGDSSSDFIRFGTNTVLGLGGFFDWASEFGLDPHYEDFGQTLGRWGVPAGAYIVWPILGSSTVRDSIGLPIDIKASPDQIAQSVRVRNTLTAVRVVNARANLLGATGLLDDIALDKYTFIRDAYLQRRRSLIYDGAPPDGDQERYDLPEPGSAAASAPPPAASAPPPAASAPQPAASAPER